MAFEDLGTDIGGGYDLDPAWRIVRGSRALADCIVRRLTTDAGAIPDHPAYGFNVENLIGTTFSESRIRQRVSAQVYAEEEVQDAVITVAKVGDVVVINIIVSAGEAPFPLTLNISQVGVDVVIPPEL